MTDLRASALAMAERLDRLAVTLDELSAFELADENDTIDTIDEIICTKEAASLLRRITGEETGDEAYLVWSNEHRMWWRPNRCGYTRVVAPAGRYSRDEAIAIARSARGGWREGDVPPEMAIAERDALACESPPPAPQGGET